MDVRSGGGINGAVNVETGMLSLPGAGLGISVEADRGHCAIALPEASRLLATGRCHKSRDSGCTENIIVVARGVERRLLMASRHVLVGLLRQFICMNHVTINKKVG